MCSLVNSIVKCGYKSDADAILNQYLTNPNDFHYTYLIPVFKKFEDHSIAEQIFNVSIKQNKLSENDRPEILELLGQLKFTPIKQILADYIFGGSNTDYYISKYAILGLLNFNCSEYQKQIEIEIERCYGKNLFSEFVPALVCKLKDRNSILEKLYELGDKFASTDCNAGIVLGFSLCGEQGRRYFKKVLFSRNWEIYSFETGTIQYAYQRFNPLN